MLVKRLRAEHQPTIAFETDLIEKMAQHFWLAQRAVLLQEICFDRETPHCDCQKQLALYLRYQTTHERAFERCVKELRSLRNESRKQKIGFECGTCKIHAMGSGQVPFEAGFGEADKALRYESAA